LRRIWARLVSDESGYNLIELLTAMGILGVVMTSLTTVLVSATNAVVYLASDRARFMTGSALVRDAGLLTR